MIVRGGTIVDQTGERNADIVVEKGRIAAVGEAIEPGRSMLVLDAGGCIVSSGLVDLHAHLREPGGEDAETIESGSRAAAVGGYTAVVAMANTDPPIDCAAVVRDVLDLARSASCEVAPAGAVTVGRSGERLAPMFEMAKLGVRIFTDDGRGVQDAGVMRRALEYGRDLDIVIAEHCEDESLSHHGHMHEGEWSSRLGVPAQPAIAEEAMVARDIALARLTGARLHLLHLSSAVSVALVASAKRDGVEVTAEATPHHITLTDAALSTYDPRFKVNPPLRESTDTEAVRAGLRDGTIDAVATDHAPHTEAAKEAPLDEAPPGFIGLETAYAVCYGALIADTNGASPLSLRDLLALLSWSPARIAGLDRSSGQGGPIEKGAPASLCVFDPTERWTVGATPFASRSSNSPFSGMKLSGRVRHTIYRGEPVVVDAVAQR